MRWNEAHSRSFEGTVLDDEDFEALRREATAWIVRITSGKATTDDAGALQQWRARSDAHEQAFRDAARLWKQLGRALEPQAAAKPPLLSRRSFLATGAVAASAAGVAFSLSELGFLPSLEALASDYATAIGEQRVVHLPDGSVATLDGGTAINLNFSSQERNLVLTSGAAVFDVVEERHRPFTVTALSGVSRSGEASFSVRHGVADVSVECLRGDVSVHCLGDADLAEGEAISYSDLGLGEKTATDIETAAAWRKGLMIFNNRPLADVVSDLNRHRRGKVMIARRDLRSRRVSGVFHLNRPEEILAHLENTLNVHPINLIGGVVLLQ